MTDAIFDHDRLDVYRLAIEYTAEAFAFAKDLSGVHRHALAFRLASTRVSRGSLELNVPARQSPLITGWPGRDGTGTVRLNVSQTVDDTSAPKLSATGPTLCVKNGWRIRRDC